MRMKIFVCLLLFIAVGGAADAQKVSAQPVYVLVHGAWHGGWCWKEVEAALTAEGAVVYTPTLAGLGEHANTLDTNVNLNTHIEDIVSFIKMQDLRKVVLVGHSYGGIVITGVADRIPDRLAKLVYLDALLAESGQSALSIQPVAIQQAVRKSSQASNGLTVPVWPASSFGVTDTAKASWVNERLTPQPFRSFAQPLALQHAFGNQLPLFFIACTNPEMPQLEVFARKARESKRWTYYELPTGHDAMITQPAALSALLQTITAL
ncbi:pimeloyl-ACP methyl ester carboxylesterase [Filimonas zeae]|uniref:Esterase n=1 Tax=Filimonas zeae TaxID=1737353 RepID=A0A917IN98_9BACT|nr:alpha/beta hydrolase [Filimonas zeae]MDR6337630.1 pimeloyl-ACP methyl ester carboxylesterase [Filimonas zeae]GGH59543.1 esterase [Filimonas zeae]